MEIGFCEAALIATGSALLGLAGAFWKVLGWWRDETKGRLEDQKALRLDLEDHSDEA